MKRSIDIDVWSDVACPWCYIGKRRLEAGIEESRAGDTVGVEVEFHSFELNPDLPVDFDGDAVDFLARHKGIPESQAQRLQAHVAGIAAGEGLDYDFDSLQPTNTAKAHQLLHLARERGVQSQAKERLLRAHFTEELADLGVEVGLDRDEILASLRSGHFLPAVRRDERRAAEIGILGVPFFVVDRRYAISGAQPAGSFAQVLDRVLAVQEDETVS